MPFGLQPLDLIVIALVALVIFGPKRLPQLGRWLGKTFASFRRGARDLADGFSEEARAQEEKKDAATPPATADATGPKPVADASCAACGAANPEGSLFCNRCGARLTP